MLRFPVHPRYARMFLAAQERGCVRPVAMIAALTQGRSFLLRGVPRQVEEAREEALGEEHESDFFLLMRAWRYADRSGFSVDACRAAGDPRPGGPAGRARSSSSSSRSPRTRASTRRSGGSTGARSASASSPASRTISPTGSTPGRCGATWSTGAAGCSRARARSARRRSSSPPRSPRWAAARGEVSVLLSLATAVEEAWLGELFPGELRDEREVAYDPAAKRVVARRERRFRDLVLESKSQADDVPPDEAAALLAREVVAGQDHDRRLGRVRRAVDHPGQPPCRVVPRARGQPDRPLGPDDADRAGLLRRDLGARREGQGGHARPQGLADRGAAGARWTSWCPSAWPWPNGRRSRLTYPKEGPPVLSARIQELYGIEGRFSLGRGRVPVKIEVLAPEPAAHPGHGRPGGLLAERLPEDQARALAQVPAPRMALITGTATGVVSIRLRDEDPTATV